MAAGRGKDLDEISLLVHDGVEGEDHCERPEEHAKQEPAHRIVASAPEHEREPEPDQRPEDEGSEQSHLFAHRDLPSDPTVAPEGRSL